LIHSFISNIYIAPIQAIYLERSIGLKLKPLLFEQSLVSMPEYHNPIITRVQAAEEV